MLKEISIEQQQQQSQTIETAEKEKILPKPQTQSDSDWWNEIKGSLEENVKKSIKIDREQFSNAIQRTTSVERVVAEMRTVRKKNINKQINKHKQS